MENNYKNKNIAIVGFGKTGESCTRFFLNKNVSSIKVTDALEKNIPSDLRNTICTFDFSSLNSKWILDSDLIVLSPGISLDLEVISKAKIKGIEIVNDIELFARENKTPLIGITGSNGKTTTVSLLTEVLINFGYKVALGGNVGTPILSLLNSSYDFFVIELSSFQLEAISKLDLEIGVILNITDDHLDRHYSYENYLNIKKKIFKNSKCQIANISLMPFLNEYKGVSYFGEGTNCKYLENSTILLNNLEYNLKTDIRGKQFIYNAIIVLMIINKMDLDLKKAIEYISLFKPSKHRFSLVSRYKDASWIDDSKATNEGSAIAALDNFQKNDDIYLLLGGVSKGCNFLNLKKFLTKFINIKVYAFGESKLKFQDIFKDTILCNTLEEAVLKINNKVKKDSIILLAPGCSSFDQFMNYADRGNKFIEIIGKLNG